jgi:hypothetical protein
MDARELSRGDRPGDALRLSDPASIGMQLDDLLQVVLPFGTSRRDDR